MHDPGSSDCSGAELTQFNPADYWESRLKNNFGLHGVGQKNWGPYFNWWAYKVRRRVFVCVLRALGLDLRTLDVLDVGTGTGFYIDCWRQLEARSVTGIDIAEVAVRNLTNRYPGVEFHKVDVSGDLGPLRGRRFDAVSCMDVLFHIVDDIRYQTAFENIKNILKPGGFLIFSEGFVHGPTRRSIHIVHRSLSEVQHTLQATGFRVLYRRPFLVLMNDPVEPGAVFLRMYWRLLHAVVPKIHLAGTVLGAVLYPLEAALVSMLKESPTTEVMVCQHEGGDRQ